MKRRIIEIEDEFFRYFENSGDYILYYPGGETYSLEYRNTPAVHMGDDGGNINVVLGKKVFTLDYCEIEYLTAILNQYAKTNGFKHKVYKRSFK